MAIVPASVPECEMAPFPPSALIRASVVQACTVFGDTSATLLKAERLIEEAASLGAQIIVFPEAFLGGYPRGSSFGTVVGYRTARGREDFRRYHATAIDVPGQEVERLSAAAASFKVHLVMGVVERSGATLYCTVLFFDSQGRFLGKHRKCVPTAMERVIFGYGDGSTLSVFKTDVGQLGGLICWENRMPLLRTALYAKGIEIYCAPNADARENWQSTVQHIAVEGGCFVLSCNQFCRRSDYPPDPEYVFEGVEEELSPDSVVCSGGSVIISPSGKVLAGPNHDGETILTADLDLGDIIRAKFEFDAVGHYARPEVVNLRVNEKPFVPVTFIQEDKVPDGGISGPSSFMLT